MDENAQVVDFLRPALTTQEPLKTSTELGEQKSDSPANIQDPQADFNAPTQSAQTLDSSPAPGTEAGRVDLPIAQRNPNMAGPASDPLLSGQITTLDGDFAEDEFSADAINYQILLRKIDALLERLKLDA